MTHDFNRKRYTTETVAYAAYLLADEDVFR
jgi:hypothetical protein